MPFDFNPFTGKLDKTNSNLLDTDTATSFTAGSVIFVGADQTLHEDNTNLFFNDNTNAFLVGGGLTIGVGAAGVDYTLTFDGESNDCVITYDEDNDILDVASSGITMQSNSSLKGFSALTGNDADYDTTTRGFAVSAALGANKITTAGNFYALASEATWEPSAAGMSGSGYFALLINGGGSNNITQLSGMDALCLETNLIGYTGTITDSIGCRAIVQAFGSTVTTNSYGLRAAVAASGTAKSYAVNIFNATGSGGSRVRAIQDDSPAAASWSLAVDNKELQFGAGDDAVMYYDGTDFIIDPDAVGTGIVLIGATGDDDMKLNEIEIDGDLNHDGTNIGFYGVAPVARPAAYTQTYATATRTHAARTAPGAGTGSGADATTFNGAECDALAADQQNTAQVLNQLIDDLQANGIIQ